MQHNQYGTPLARPSDCRLNAMRSLLVYPPLTLDDKARTIVDQTIRDHCCIREWPLHALNVRINHVHVVLSCGDQQPERAMEQLKAWSTRRLRENSLTSADRPVWTEHGSTRYLWDDVSRAAAIEYVTHWQ